MPTHPDMDELEPPTVRLPQASSVESTTTKLAPVPGRPEPPTTTFTVVDEPEPPTEAFVSAPTLAAPEAAAEASPPQDLDAPEHGLASRFRRGLSLSLLNTVVARGATFALGVVLARLLSPEEFGLYATALVVQMFLLVINELGVGGALVRRRGSVDDMIPTSWTMAVGGGLGCMVACVLLAPTFATLMGSPQASGVIQVMSIGILSNGFASVPASLLKRDLQQGKRFVADMVGLVTNVALTAGLAFAGAGPWSLAIGNVAGGALVVVVMIVQTRCWPRFGFDRRYAGEIGKVGLSMTASAVLLVSLQAAPQAVAGRYLGASAIGFFFIANNVANWPISIISTTLERVALATFSRVREGGGDLAETAAAIIGLVAGSVLIAGTALAVLAGPLLDVVYGEAWMPAAVVLSGLAIGSVARVVAELVFNLLVATDSVLMSVLPQAIWLVGLVPASAYGAHRWGLEGIGIAQAAVALVWAVPMQLWCARRAGASPGSMMKALIVPALISGVLALALLGVRSVITAPLAVIAISAPIAAVALGVALLRSKRMLNSAMGGLTVSPVH